MFATYVVWCHTVARIALCTLHRQPLDATLLPVHHFPFKICNLPLLQIADCDIEETMTRLCCCEDEWILCHYSCVTATYIGNCNCNHMYVCTYIHVVTGPCNDSTLLGSSESNSKSMLHGTWHAFHTEVLLPNECIYWPFRWGGYSTALC